MKKFLAIFFAVLMLIPAVPTVAAEQVEAATVPYQQLNCEIAGYEETPTRYKVGNYYYWAKRGENGVELHAAKSQKSKGLRLATMNEYAYWNNTVVTILTNGSWVYYVDYSGDWKNPSIKRINTSGKNKSTVYTLKSWRGDILLQHYYSGMVYFTEYNADKSYYQSICGVNVSTKKFKRFYTKAEWSMGSGRYLYYSRETKDADGYSEIRYYVFDCKQNKYIKRLYGNPGLGNIANNRLYYIEEIKQDDGSYKTRLVSCKLNGSDKKILIKNVYMLSFYFYQDTKGNSVISDYVYYNASKTDYKKVIYTTYNIKTGEKVRHGSYAQMLEDLGKYPPKE